MWPFCQSNKRCQVYSWLLSDETTIYFLLEHCGHVSHCQSDFNTIIFQFAPYQRALLLKNACLTSYMNPNKGRKNGGTWGKMRMLKNFESQETDRFGCHLFLTAWEVIEHLRDCEVFQDRRLFFVFSHFKKMLELSRVSLKSDFNVKFGCQHAERAPGGLT